MIKLARHNILHTWIALLAILFSVVAPTVSRAVAASNPAAPMLEMCTVNGYQLVKLPGSDSGKAPADAMQGMQHCAFCGMHGASDALPSAPAVMPLLAVGRNIYPPLFYSAPHQLHTWSAANPRAPPVLA
jgi:uncharacterized protein involved in copper resistance